MAKVKLRILQEMPGTFPPAEKTRSCRRDNSRALQKTLQKAMPTVEQRR
ncbi:MAG: hypothetical protein NZ602_07780 [Thermoguttaceae bacterium]|nr:hypothetical protein [Thermoguttaceae bacterium]